eukprot:GSA25T00012464001.1
MWLGDIRMPGVYGESNGGAHKYFFTVQDGLDPCGPFVVPLSLQNKNEDEKQRRILETLRQLESK